VSFSELVFILTIIFLQNSCLPSGCVQKTNTDRPQLSYRNRPVCCLLFVFCLVWFVRLLALRPPWPIVPASGDSEDNCGEADGMYIGRGNRSSRRKPASAPFLSITKSHMTRHGFEPGPPRWEAGG
jgi:hypothetical protein